jgi:hypothetical protein
MVGATCRSCCNSACCGLDPCLQRHAGCTCCTVNNQGLRLGFDALNASLNYMDFKVLADANAGTLFNIGGTSAADGYVGRRGDDNDTYIFRRGSGRDTIQGWNVGDRIWLTADGRAVNAQSKRRCKNQRQSDATKTVAVCACSTRGKMPQRSRWQN